MLVQGTVLTFNCDPGYQLEDDTGDMVLCGQNGTWTRPIPKCKPIICESPQNVRNGKTEFGGTTYGQVANYKCKKGHYLIGPHNSTCSEIGVWVPPPPTCFPVDCGEPEPLAHGHVRYEDTTYKHVAHLSCQPGYTLKGADTRLCTTSGIWSKKQPR